mmetsp:Transcript_32035/g.44666  ORF Transcript_32035/g.44666 Transcript_32035/m.44666 type:complete len:97 (-) Transcript_32035:241-531(-)
MLAGTKEPVLLPLQLLGRWGGEEEEEAAATEYLSRAAATRTVMIMMKTMKKKEKVSTAALAKKRRRYRKDLSLLHSSYIRFVKVVKMFYVVQTVAD